MTVDEIDTCCKELGCQRCHNVANSFVLLDAFMKAIDDATWHFIVDTYFKADYYIITVLIYP